MSCSEVTLTEEGAKAKFKNDLDAWKGHSKTQLVYAWGAPMGETKIKDKVAMTYTQQSVWGNMHKTLTTQCTFTWIIDKNEKIETYFYNGHYNECYYFVKDLPQAPQSQKT